MTDRDLLSIPPDPGEGGTEATERSRSAEPTERDVSASEDVLTAIADPDCQTILAASAERPLSVSDVVDQCDIPTATAYRKVDMLVESGLLDERIQIRPYGRNEHQYSLQVEAIHVNLAEGGVPEATIRLADGGGAAGTGQAITDGGRTSRGESEGSESDELRSIFVDITGTEELVDEQETDGSVRQLPDGERSVSEYVPTVTRDDDLDDSLPDGQVEE